MCLLQEMEVDLLTPLRASASDTELRQSILDAVWHKPWGHGLDQDVVPLNRVMSQIGG
jgi:cyclic pyranopterin phosphate synthase